MHTDMGYSNIDRVYQLAEDGRLAKDRAGKATVDNMALNALLYMAHNTYDWPPAEKVRDNMLPCRYYTLGWRRMAQSLGMTLLSFEQLQSDSDPDALRKSRELTARTRISHAWKFLAEHELIKQLVPASLGRNAGYLLLLGDASENREVEAWARKCLGLPGR